MLKYHLISQQGGSEKITLKINFRLKDTMDALENNITANNVNNALQRSIFSMSSDILSNENPINESPIVGDLDTITDEHAGGVGWSNYNWNWEDDGGSEPADASKFLLHCTKTWLDVETGVKETVESLALNSFLSLFSFNMTYHLDYFMTIVSQGFGTTFQENKGSLDQFDLAGIIQKYYNDHLQKTLFYGNKVSTFNEFVFNDVLINFLKSDQFVITMTNPASVFAYDPTTQTTVPRQSQICKNLDAYFAIPTATIEKILNMVQVIINTAYNGEGANQNILNIYQKLKKSSDKMLNKFERSLLAESKILYDDDHDMVKTEQTMASLNNAIWDGFDQLSTYFSNPSLANRGYYNVASTKPSDERLRLSQVVIDKRRLEEVEAVKTVTTDLDLTAEINKILQNLNLPTPDKQPNRGGSQGPTESESGASGSEASGSGQRGHQTQADTAVVPQKLGGDGSGSGSGGGDGEDGDGDQATHVLVVVVGEHKGARDAAAARAPAPAPAPALAPALAPAGAGGADPGVGRGTGTESDPYILEKNPTHDANPSSYYIYFQSLHKVNEDIYYTHPTQAGNQLIKKVTPSGWEEAIKAKYRDNGDKFPLRLSFRVP